MTFRFQAAFLIAVASLVLVSRTWAKDEVSGSPISEPYRQQFADCDKTDRFGDVQLPIKRLGKTIWYGCKSDPSRLTRLERISAKGEKPEAIFFEAKLARDDDGSPKACNTPGATDQCGTSFMLKPTAARPCPAVLAKKKASDPYCLPVDADEIPYIVVPGFGPKGIDSAEFRSKTGIAMGDLGVVIAEGKVIPVIVADVGPAYKIGEGSAALLRKLSTAGKPTTINRGVQYIVFPDSSVGRDTSADTLRDDVNEKAMELYNRLIATPSTGS